MKRDSITMKDSFKIVIYRFIEAAVYPKGKERRFNESLIRFPFSVSRYYPPDYEPHKQDFIEKHASGIALDLGAHIGLYTVLLSRKANSVIAFEPTSATRTILQKTLSMNNCRNVNVRSEAVSATSGFANFYDTGDIVSNANSLLPIGVPSEIRTVSIDDLAIKFDFIKMDIEGAELLALKGAYNTLKSVKYMAIELHPDLLHDSGNTVKDVLDLLLPHQARFEYQGRSVEYDFLCSLTDSFEVNVFLNGAE